MPTEHVVFVGVPGLMWSDVTAAGTPNLAGLTGHASSGALSVRTVDKTTCPTDGWLTVGAGARAGAERSGGCGPMPAPVVAGDGALTVPDLPGIAHHNDKYSYDPEFGAVASAVARAGRCVTAVGPGAAVATADKEGRSPAGYLPDAAGLDQAALARCALTLVDLGPTVDATAPDRADRFRAADAALGRIAAALPPHTRLVVAGIADDGATPHLRVSLAAGPGTDCDSGLLTSTSTRYDGMVQLTDVAPSLLDPFGIEPPDAMVGAAVTRTGGPSGADAVHDLDLLDVGAQAARTVRESYQFFTWLTLVPLVVFAGGIGWTVRQRRRGAPPAARRKVYRGLQGVAVAAASVPAASFLVGLFPWTEASSPEWATIGITLGGTAVLAGLAFAGPWRRHPYGPAGFAAAATFVVLAGDVITGSHLQMNTLFGLSPLIAGRFYGFGNVAWSIYGMAVLLAAAWPVGRSLEKEPERRRKAVVLLVVCGLAAIVVNGWPAFGSDFGGVLALVPGFAVLGLLLTGVRISWGKAGLVALGAVAAVAVISVLDWMRPKASRSHLGKFVQQVIDGDAGAVLRRKIMDNLGSFHQPVSFLIPVLLVLLLVALLEPPRLRATALPPAYARVPWLRPVLIACWVTAVVGYAVNDSGIQIPSVALLLAVPLGAAVLAAVAAEEASGSGGGGADAPRTQAEPQGAE
ncbi:MAG: hypothetical protein HOV68_00425 [Streptomycetaceae bacterium]|nr:hypothetical protein [Streptomycetaceae bacterium]